MSDSWRERIYTYLCEYAAEELTVRPEQMETTAWLLDLLVTEIDR